MLDTMHVSPNEVAVDNGHEIIKVANDIVESGKLGQLEEVFQAEVVEKGRTFRVLDSRGSVLTDITATSLQDLVAQMQELREAGVD